MTGEIPVATHSGTFVLLGVTLHCHRLSNGHSVIEEADIIALLKAMEDGPDFDGAELRAFTEWLRAAQPAREAE